MTIAACPQGCGGYIDTASNLAYCPSCRRNLHVQYIHDPALCWEWFGPDWHRMRCRKQNEHSGVHSTHDNCGATNNGSICGFENDHEGKHAWESQNPFDLLFELKNEYWIEFSKLIAQTLKKAPAHLHDELLMMLQESSSVYGSGYDKYL
jgi:hypothetical protein